MISTGLVLSAILAAGVVASEWTAYPVAEAPAVDLGDRVGLLRPLVEQPICAPCHGPVERMSPAVKAAIAARYPGDRAIGFANGDLRGWFWVEVPKQPRAR